MHSLDPVQIRSILIRSTNWLGDAVMTTPAISAIRSFFPHAWIVILANPLVAELFSCHEGVDGVIVYDRKGMHRGISGRLKLAARLRKERFDLAILLQNAIDAAMLAWLARIPRRMGYRTDGRGLFLTHGTPVGDHARKLHHVDYYLAMLGHFGIAAAARKLRLDTRKDEDEALAGLLSRHGIAADDFVIGINPGAAYGSAKRWYPERFAEVGSVLKARWNAGIVITGGVAETAMAGEIESALKGNCLNLAGKTSVRQLMSLIKRCNFFITNDSGPMHLAAAFDVPLVAVFGPTDHSTTSPFGDHAALVRHETQCAPCLLRECPTDHRCMSAVTADQVVDAAVLLAERLKLRRRNDQPNGGSLFRKEV